jgi:acetyl esterase
MPLHPQVVKALEQMKAAGPPLHKLPPKEARAAMEAARGQNTKPEPVGTVEDRNIPGITGKQAIRIYTPKGAGPFPIMVYFHGGGWVVGSINTVDASCRALANLAECIVISSDYRLAPEDKFPAAIDDCYAATRWAALNAAAFNGISSRIAVGGESAGANLAAAVTLKSAAAGLPTLAFQLLMYPVTAHGSDMPSHKENAEGYFLTTEMMGWFWAQYLPTATDGKNPLASPLQATLEQCRSVPPAFIATAQYDPLRDEGAAYAEKLRDAGVPAKYKCYDGLIHGFMGMAKAIEPAGLALEEAARELKAGLNASN